MADTKHTQLPWKVSEVSGWPSDICDADGELLATAYPMTIGGEDAGEANAAFIVRACNAHDQLVAALKLLCDTIDAHEIESLSCDRDGEKYCDCLRSNAAAARAALTAAEA